MDQVHLETEALSWLEAHDVGGAPLTPEIAEARREWDEADKAVRALVKPDDPVSASKLVAQGWTVEDAEAEVDARYRAALDWKRRRETLIEVRSFKARALNLAVVSSLEEIVLAARPTVTKIVDDARPQVEKILRFGPVFDTETIVAKASAAELRAYQAVLALQTRLDSITRAWARSYVTPLRISKVHEVSHSAGRFGWAASDVAQERYYWDAPELVREPRLNGQALSRRGSKLPPSTSLLLIAQEEPAAGFRLAVFGDLRARAYEEWQTRKDAFQLKRPQMVGF